MQALGGVGTANDFGLPAMFATARLLRLADGPDEVHRNQLGRLELRRFEAQEPPKYMPGASKWPLEHTLGHRGPQKGALWVAFGGQDVEFGSVGAPKVFKMDPLGTPLGRLGDPLGTPWGLETRPRRAQDAIMKFS